MNETPSVPILKPRKRKASAPRAPRVIDPAIAAIRAETAAKVKAYRDSVKSGKRLANILKLVDTLTGEDFLSLIANVNARKP